MARLFSLFTGSLRDVLTLAQDAALHANANAIDSTHLLIGLARERDGVAATELGAGGVTPAMLRTAYSATFIPARSSAPATIDLSSGAKKVIEATVQASGSNPRAITTIHLLVAVVQSADSGFNALLDQSFPVKTGEVQSLRQRLTLITGSLPVVSGVWLSVLERTSFIERQLPRSGLYDPDRRNPGQRLRDAARRLTGAAPDPSMRTAANQCSERMCEAFVIARAVANADGAGAIQPEHLLLAVAAQPSSVAADLLKHANAETEALRLDAAATASGLEVTHDDPVRISAESKVVLREAARAVALRDGTSLGTGDLLAGLAHHRDRATDHLWQFMSLDPASVKSTLNRILDSGVLPSSRSWDPNRANSPTTHD